MTPRANLPQLELDCMKALWRLGAASVAQVRSALPRPLAYTTIMTVLQRMSAKGVVERHKNGRAYIYSPLLDLDTARRSAVTRVLTDLFESDRDALLKYVSAMGRSSAAGAPVRPLRRRAGASVTGRDIFVPQIDETLL